MKSLKILLSIFGLFFQVAFAQEDYSFDLSEIEQEVAKKPYSIGGYLEFRSNILWLDNDAALYTLRYYDQAKRSNLEEYHFQLLLDASYEKGIAAFFLRTNVGVIESDVESDVEADLFEGYVSLRPSPFFTVDCGKQTLNWGKGYAWNPVAFVDRPKNPDDPALPLEGFIVASADYTRSFKGVLDALTFTPVFIPVYEDINDDFGEINHVNFAGKLYFLFYDTDIDIMFLTGGSRPSRVGIDFARNITTNFEIHGEFAFINNFEHNFINSNGLISKRTYDAKSYLVGIRYLTPYDTTLISEYYRNGTGFTKNEVEDFFSFIDKGYDMFLTSGDDSSLRSAQSLAEKSYGKRNQARDYVFLRISQKEPFDILYLTPSITGIFNIGDSSYSLSPELLYTGITNLELRLKGGVIVGERQTEYGEKQNNYRVEFRVRYYFNALKFLPGFSSGG